MIYNRDIIKHIRAVEASLLESQKVDVYNSAHTTRMLNAEKCKDSLKDCVLSVYCQSIYDRFIYPIYFYIEYTNNWLTLSKFSSYMEKDDQETSRILDEAKRILDAIN